MGMGTARYIVTNFRAQKLRVFVLVVEFAVMSDASWRKRRTIHWDLSMVDGAFLRKLS